MLSQPVLRREFFEGGSELAVNFSPCLPKFRSWQWIGESPVRVCDEGFIQLRMEPVADPKHGQHTIMHRRQVTHEVKQAVLAGCDLFLDLLVSERSQALIEPADNELPRVDRSNAEEFLVGHFEPPFQDLDLLV